jgi:hypothetical protein
VADWYTIYFLTSCSGYYAPVHLAGGLDISSSASALAVQKVNVTCTREAGGYTFDLFVKTGLQYLLANVTFSDGSPNIIDTQPMFAVFLVGCVLASLVICALPLTVLGLLHSNGRLALVAFVSLVFLFLEISMLELSVHQIRESELYNSLHFEPRKLAIARATG